MHKKACKKRAAELYEEALFKEVEPEECPICLLPMPKVDETLTKSCCGKRICHGCIYTMVEREGNKFICAFCRTPAIKSDEEEIERTKKLMEVGNAEAYFLLAGYYANGGRGIVQDERKARELMLKAGELGCAQAYANLGEFYRDGIGVNVDRKKAKQYIELAAMRGHAMARASLGCMEFEDGNVDRAMKHWKLSARIGFDMALDMVKHGFENGMITKDEYEKTLGSYQARQDEMKSDARDKARVSIGIFMR